MLLLLLLRPDSAQAPPSCRSRAWQLAFRRLLLQTLFLLLSSVFRPYVTHRHIAAFNLLTFQQTTEEPDFVVETTLVPVVKTIFRKRPSSLPADVKTSSAVVDGATQAIILPANVSTSAALVASGGKTTVNAVQTVTAFLADPTPAANGERTSILAGRFQLIAALQSRPASPLVPP